MRFRWAAAFSVTALLGMACGGGGSGVVINQGASYNTIGGTTAAARDVILGNKSYGVYITDGNTAHNVVEGDAIGTDITGTHGNDGSGRSYANGLSGVAAVRTVSMRRATTSRSIA